ncbi:MAG: sigma-70 family RNA polymerase sigma factor [Bryobacteraceae bacterium]
MSDAPILQYYAGSDEAFEEIYSEWWLRLVRFLTALGAPWHLAEEIAQEALYRIARTRVQGARYIPGPGTFDGWILMVARNVWMDDLRRRSRRENAVDGALLANRGQPARQEADALLHELLAKLPPEQREALILHDFEGLSYREAAEILKVSQGTVANWRELGLTKLRLHWKVGVVPEEAAR